MICLSGWHSSTNNQLSHASRSALVFSVSIVILLVIAHHKALANTGNRNITVSIQPAQPRPGGDVTLSFQIDNADSIYYFGLKLAYESNLISFVSSQPGPLMGTNSIHIADVTSMDTLGASTSRTSGSASGNGTLFKLTFHINKNDNPGPLQFKISSLSLRDSTGNYFTANYKAAIDTSIAPKITNAKLLFSSDTLIVGQTGTVKSSVLARGITDASGQSDKIHAWIGYSATNENPSTWNDTTWIASAYSNDSGESDDYSTTIGSGLPVGTYYIAARFQLNSQSYVYAGFNNSGGGIWNGTTYKSGILVIKKKPPYRTKLVVWNFNDDNLIADRGIKANRHDTLHIHGAGLDGWATGNSGNALNTNGWDATGKPEYYEIHISTKYYKNLRLDSDQYGSNSGPKNFVVEYSTNNQTWSSIPDSNITVGNDWTSGNISNISLPAETWNQSDLYLRWKKSTQIRVSGDTGISSVGTNRIDNIIISGEDNNPTPVTVWPGDTNNDGSVDESDVLALGQNWELEGPPRQDSLLNWQAKTAVEWHPPTATYSDADGNGVVDESDLFPIGKNFNKTNTHPKTTNRQPRILTFSKWPHLQPDDRVTITISTKNSYNVKGVSYRFSINNTPPNDFSIDRIQAGIWSTKWSNLHELLSFIQNNQSGSAGAWVHKGDANPIPAKSLFSFHFIIHDTTFNSAKLEIEKIDILNNKIRTVSPDSLTVSISVEHTTPIDKGPHIIRKTKLEDNYPNPFNPATNIQYELSANTKVVLTIYNILGRKVAALVNKVEPAGEYEVTWNAEHFASGLYFYRLQTRNHVFTKKMMLIK